MGKEPKDKIKFYLREEKLDVIKKWINTGECQWHKEIITEEKNYSIPLKREELVVEQNYPDPASPGSRIETIRIPLREERPDISRQTFDLEEVQIYKKPVRQHETVRENLRKEVLVIKSSAGQEP
ncbi:MAG: YsnF/AvaK domain-containing protein [Syntrophomonadaceae bacterium]|nr:YsnF/AvaK domain-containing protein [Syntrophomonadaceae bacterium]